MESTVWLQGREDETGGRSQEGCRQQTRVKTLVVCLEVPVNQRLDMGGVLTLSLGF